MNFSRLENQMIDVIKEEQIKLGYRSETIRLYYPLETLNRLLAAEEKPDAQTGAAEGQGLSAVPGPSTGNCTFDASGMQALLEKEFRSRVSDSLGDVAVSHKGDRFCFRIPPEGADYVHRSTDENDFLVGFIRLIGRHGCTVEELLAHFRKYTDRIRLLELHDGEVDYVIYSETGTPDDYRYCITDEGCHLIYHRFTPEDFAELYPESGGLYPSQ